MATFTIKQLTEIMPKLDGVHSEAVKFGKSKGLNYFQVDVLRGLLGYSKEIKPRDKKLCDKVISIFTDNPNITANRIYREYGKKLGLKNYQQVYDILRHAGLETNRAHAFWTKMKEMRLVDARDRRHMTWRQISELFNKEVTADACSLKYMAIRKAK